MEEYTVLANKLSRIPNLAEYRKAYGKTHYDFLIFSTENGWGVTAIPKKQVALFLRVPYNGTNKRKGANENVKH